MDYVVQMTYPDSLFHCLSPPSPEAVLSSKWASFSDMVEKHHHQSKLKWPLENGLSSCIHVNSQKSILLANLSY